MFFENQKHPWRRDAHGLHFEEIASGWPAASWGNPSHALLGTDGKTVAAGLALARANRHAQSDQESGTSAILNRRAPEIRTGCLVPIYRRTFRAPLQKTPSAQHR